MTRAPLLHNHATLFQDFIGREHALAQIIRYKNYPAKLYPTNLQSHQHQVAALVVHLINLLELHQENILFEPHKAVIMAWIHDDHEPFMEAGDFQSGNEVHITAEEKQTLLSDTLQAIERRRAISPSLLGSYSYGKLLMDAAHTLTSVESQLVKLADKMVGLGEALHEIHSGNDSFRYGVVDPTFGRPNPSPVEYYSAYFSRLNEKLPLLMASLESNDHWFLQSFPTEEFPLNHYQLWKEAILQYAPDWEQRRLFSRVQ